MPLYLWEGKLLVENGKLAVHEDCCCNVCRNCCDGQGIPTTISAAFSGITFCPDCRSGNHFAGGTEHLGDWQYTGDPNVTVNLDRIESPIEGYCWWCGEQVTACTLREWDHLSGCVGAPKAEWVLTAHVEAIWSPAKETGAWEVNYWLGNAQPLPDFLDPVFHRPWGQDDCEDNSPIVRANHITSNLCNVESGGLWQCDTGEVQTSFPGFFAAYGGQVTLTVTCT